MTDIQPPQGNGANADGFRHSALGKKERPLSPVEMKSAEGFGLI
ncbi:hypothetical protein [Xaviernesmea oryzae]|nr:hypothetical protein [Xaviernesmea oryzae]